MGVLIKGVFEEAK